MNENDYSCFSRCDSCEGAYSSHDKRSAMAPQRTIIIDPRSGKVITTVPLYASVGKHAFHQAEALGYRFVDGQTYLTIPVNNSGVPISTYGHVVWQYVAPIAPKSSAKRVEV